MARFERIKYPDGQISAKFTGEAPRVSFQRKDGSNPFTISERINSYADLFYVRSIADVINHSGSGTRNYKLFIPCMFGQRSDRRFTEFQSFDLKLIADVINECHWGSVDIFDPHSDVTTALIEKSTKVSSFPFVNKAVVDIMGKQVSKKGLVLVSPDAGAYKKVFEYGQTLNIPVVGAMKHRDKDGNINLLFSQELSGEICLIVDDLCDGGFTFLNLAKKLREKGAGRVYLYVSHGIFSKGFNDLLTVIDRIYCTNSVKDLDLESEFAFNSEAFKLKEFVTQFKII